MAKKKGPMQISKGEGDAVLAVTEVMKTLNVNALSAQEPDVRFGNTYNKATDAISTGSLAIDHITGCGGFPIGRMSEIYGAESSGKSTLCYIAAREAQKKFPNKLVYLNDNEHSYVEKMFIKYGGDPSRIVVASPLTGEEQMDMLEKMILTGHFSLAIVDSVEGVIPRAELESDSGESNMGKKAILMNQSTRKMMQVVEKTDTCLVWINQVREKIGIVFGLNEVTGGGRGLKFWSSVRLRISKVSGDTTAKEAFLGPGQIVRCKAVKTKYGPPLKTADSFLAFNSGFDIVGDILELGEKFDVFSKEKNTRFWNYKGEEISWSGRKSFMEKFDDEMIETLKKEVVQKMDKSQTFISEDEEEEEFLEDD